MTGKYTRHLFTEADAPPPANLRRAPVRAPSVEADVSVPFKQAVITGGMILVTAIIVGPLAWLGAIGPAIGVGLLFLIVLVIWCVLIFWIQPKTLWQEFAGQFKNVPAQPTPPITVWVDLSSTNGGQTYQQGKLQPPRKGGQAGLVKFMDSLWMGNSFSEREASGCGFSRAEWIELRDEFLLHGWAIWNDEAEPRQGLSLTATGRAVAARLGDGG